MAKFAKDEIMNLLGKAIGDALGGTEETSSGENARMDKLEKAVAGVAKQVETLAGLAATGFEKPKTTEEVVADALAPITKSLEEMSKKINGESDEDKPLPTTQGEFQEMINGMLKKALGETTAEGGKPKGKGKDTKEDDDISDGVIEDLVKELDDGTMEIGGVKITEDLAKETEDAAGNPLTKDQRKKRALLDDYLGKQMAGSKAAQLAKDASDDDEEDEEDDD